MAGTIAAQARQPRGLVTVNGQRIPWKSWSTDANSFYQANTFRCDVPLTALPSAASVDWFASQAQIEVEIFAGFPTDADGYTAADLKSLFFGRVDELAVDWTGTVLTISGRDLTGALIDTKTSEKYPNQTASQIAEILAGKYGLTPVVTSTSTKVGRYYEIDNVRTQDERTEWDLLTWLAREERFNCYVQGKELHFGPPASTGKPYTLTYTPPSADGAASANATRITTSHSLTLAKDIMVTVKSWHSKDGKAYVRKAQSSRAKNSVTAGLGKSTTPTQEYSYVIPGLKPDEAQNRAQQILAELSKHEFKLSFEGPADNDLSAGDTIQLSGTGTPFDQTYYPDTIVRSMSMDEGYRWRVDAKNHSPENEPNL